jgi:type I restriction enzyme S subunit
MKEVKIERYPVYKDSGVEWLGEIPEHWEAVSLGSIMELKSDKNHPDYEVLSVYREYGVIKKDSRDDNHNATSLDTSNYKAVEPGDLVVNKMKAWQGSMGVSSYKGIVSPAYITCKVNSEKIHPEYLHQLLRCNLYIGEYNRLSYGVRVGQWDMHYEDFKHIATVIPPIQEQICITAFLERKMAQIESAIGIKQKQIELLKERRQILIHHAVTRGLNQDVKLKDSGFEWIGEIPEHWYIVPMIKYASRVDYRGKTPEKVDSGIVLVTTKNIKGGIIDYEISKEYVLEKDYNAIMSRGLPKIGDILFTMEAPLGMAAVVDNTNVAIAQRIIKFHFEEKSFNSYFVNHSIQSEYFQKILQREATGSTAQGIKASKLHKLKIVKPPLLEQIEIVSYIEINSQKTLTAISLKEKEIEKLKEYKSVLINEAVTGKIKVN